MSKKQKLELTWVGKDNRPRLEPRILIEDPAKSYHAAARVSDADIFDNVLIHGDNLLALKALEADYAGKVKCAYIDPPYNTGQAFEYYDDGLEVSLWLSLMKDRLEIIKRLLRVDGLIFIQIDDNYLFHLKLICDEVFGRSNFVNLITVKTKNSSGASGGGEDKRLKKHTEFILCYCREDFRSFNPVYSETKIDELLESMESNGKSFKYTSTMEDAGSSEYIGSTVDGSGEEIKIYRQTGWTIGSISKFSKENGIALSEAISQKFHTVFTTENAQTSIRTRVQDFLGDEDGLFKIEYVPKSGRNKGRTTQIFFQGAQKRMVSFFSNVAEKRGRTVFKKEKVGTLWDKFNWNNVTREGGVRFPNGQKPEILIQHCLDLATIPGDLVLDSFAGSGTTGAVAHKMGRRWLMVELGDHCTTHIVPRMQQVIDGIDQGGVSKAVDWRGGGGFRYYEIAPSLLEKDKWGREVISNRYDAAMLAQALCKLEGFKYEPSDSVYWQQGHSSERDFIYVTTQTLGPEELSAMSEEVGEGRSLLVLCAAFRGNADLWPNLTLRKIPNHIRSKCEWGHDDYSLNVANLPMAKREPALPPPAQSGLFDGGDAA